MMIFGNAGGEISRDGREKRNSGWRTWGVRGGLG